MIRDLSLLMAAGWGGGGGHRREAFFWLKILMIQPLKNEKKCFSQPQISIN
jgi:hypothetical protein